jgi:hypothetical protein
MMGLIKDVNESWTLSDQVVTVKRVILEEFKPEYIQCTERCLSVWLILQSNRSHSISNH